ncbi:helix-turn-helix transcriptional regulator [Inhella gelatinilytica]|uniref:AlpA family phage regulatory protein n=1 Tax=Inhella gelatinilytica TaxID=2795030 RepID=A0A931NAU8_9BURK|nr:AlpA family phage regulatory protein [Inhella gelatinilytica]MBH9552873.1 AlpA family phage regulatory protein [Inhella gelatinilytica]
MANDAKTRTPQPLHAAQIADALLKLPTVQALTGLGKTSVYARIKTGEFKPIHLSKRAVRFRASEIQAWLQAQGQ